jgi:succinate-acetate transporter protein
MNGVVGLSVFVGGFAQLVAGMLEMTTGALDFKGSHKLGIED